MKKALLFSCLLLCISVVPMKAQHVRQNVLKANLLGIGIGGFSLAYERRFTDRLSATATGRFMFFDFKDTKTFTFNNLGAVEVDYEVEMNLQGILPEVRWYAYSLFKKDAPEGLYLAPYAGFTRTRFDVKSLTTAVAIESGTNIVFAEVGGTMGYQFLISNRITIDGFVGLGFSSLTLSSVDVTVRSNTSNEIVNDFIKFDKKLPIGATLTGVLPRFGLNIGVAF